ncbi:MAG TPA: acyl-CoA thioesterase [Syntrophales bacterium]|nr:acyl-CoA thioesterase [Syntrophales bacterium]HPO36199.1 acyl-CoA thioesterase [Syntrophales bacterium]
MIDESKLESRVLHLVRPEDLNHHGTLFAGQMAKWCIEAGLMAVARLIGKPEDVVCVKFDRMIFKKPVRNGELIEIKTRISQVGVSSITVFNEVFRAGDEVPIITNSATYVTVDEHNKPYPHNLKLPPHYVEKNRDICVQVSKGD